MMWLGLAAILVGASRLAVDWSWQAQLIAFAVFRSPRSRSGGGLRAVEYPVDQPFLNQPCRRLCRPHLHARQADR
jgi:hypothetical protein